MNVNAIKLQAENGDLPGAHKALDALLELGPGNLEAIKLRARLHQVTGKFSSEAQMWEKVAQISRHDDDLMDYLIRRQGEDREHFYFTDQLPGGGRRYLAFPRQMLRAAMYGLFGCLAFFSLARLGQAWPALNHPAVILMGFVMTVLAPFFAIIIIYARSLKHISLSMEGIEIARRFRTTRMTRDVVDQVFVAHDDLGNRWQLSIIIVPKVQPGRSDQRFIEVDLSEDTTTIQARSYFIREVTRFFGEAKYVARTDIRELLKRFKSLKV